MSPEVIAVVAAGVFGIAGTVVGLIVERWVRAMGKVRCEIDWRISSSGVSVDSPSGVQVLERHLKATFLNRKDVPVTVWDMQVVFYKGGNPLDERERPHMYFVNDSGRKTALDLVLLPPRTPVTRTIGVTPDLPDQSDLVKQLALNDADRVEFLATIDGAKDIRRPLALWGQLPEDN